MQSMRYRLTLGWRPSPEGPAWWLTISYGDGQPDDVSTSVMYRGDPMADPAEIRLSAEYLALIRRGQGLSGADVPDDLEVMRMN